jgi:beta-glucosidase
LPAKPAYGFGYGLSYARFTYANGKLSGDVDAYQPVVVSADVTNASTREADEVVECDLIPKARPSAPLRKLVAFEKVHLAAGQTRTVTLSLDARTLSLVDAAGNRHVEPGDYALFVGGSLPQHRKGIELPLHVERAVEVAP